MDIEEAHRSVIRAAWSNCAVAVPASLASPLNPTVQVRRCQRGARVIEQMRDDVAVRYELLGGRYRALPPWPVRRRGHGSRRRAKPGAEAAASVPGQLCRRFSAGSPRWTREAAVDLARASQPRTRALGLEAHVVALPHTHPGLGRGARSATCCPISDMTRCLRLSAVTS